MDRILIVGGGSWGTAFANYLTHQFPEIRIWVREAEVLESIRAEQENKIFLPGQKLSPKLIPVADLEREAGQAGCLITAVPSKHIASIFQRLKGLGNDKQWINLSKGFESRSLQTISQLARDILGEDILDRWTTISGPSFAKELAQDHPTAVVAASRNEALSEIVQSSFSSDILRIYRSTDLTGIEVAGSLKNIIAIASGMCHGLGFGYNSTASLVTRANMEISRFGLKLGANQQTFWGLAGIGDLMLTCFGPLSRNFQLGKRVAQGESLTEIEGSNQMVAEGVETTKAIHLLAEKMAVDMPITRQVYNILYNNKDAREALQELMKRSLKTEWTSN